MEDEGLSPMVPISYVDVGLKNAHPILRPRDFIARLSHEGKLDLLFCGHTPTDYLAFWQRFRAHQPDHPAFGEDAGKLRNIIPVYIHCDEGTSQKKRGIMGIQFQPLLGRGTSKGSSDMNYVGHSLTNRFMYSCMMARVYSGPLKKNKPLHALVKHLAEDLRACWNEPIQIFYRGTHRGIRLAVMGLKGDWPALTKVGRLVRHHLRNVTKKAFGSGICHLCAGGSQGFEDWHNTSFSNMERMHRAATVPWSLRNVPALISRLPLSPNVEHQAQFFKIDLFHTLHKGVIGDACANALVSCIYTLCVLFVWAL